MSDAKRRKTSHGGASTSQLPHIEDFDSAEAVVARLSSRDAAALTAALKLLEKRSNAACTKDAQRRAQDAAWQYVTAYPTVDHVYAAWDTANRSNNSQLAAAVLDALAGLTRLVSCSSRAREPELIRRLVSQYGSHLERSLNPGRNDVTTAALKLCILVASYGQGRFAKRLLRSVSWSPSTTSRLYKTRLKDTSKSPLTRPDIRTLLVMLVLALLAHGDSKFRIEVIETKGLVSGMLRGISEDRETVVNLVLVSLWRDILSDRAIKLDTRRGLLDEAFIGELVKLLDKDDSPENVKSPSVSAQRFLSAATEWLAEHVVETRGRAFGSQKILGVILRTLKVTEDPRQRELALHIFEACPVLIGSYWSKFPASFEARLSSRWVAAITFATRIIASPLPTTLDLDTSKSSAPSADSIVDSLKPPQLTKQWYSKSLQADSALVSFLSALCLVATLQKASMALDVIAANAHTLEEVVGGRWLALADSIRSALKEAIPEPQLIVTLIQKVSSKQKDSAVESATLCINIYLRVLWLYHRVTPDAVAALRFDYSKLSDFVSNGSDHATGQAWSASYALRLSSLHSPALSWSRPNEYYKTTLAPLFKMLHATQTSANRRLLVGSLKRLLDSQILFKDGTCDRDVVMDMLLDPDEHIVSCFDKCLQHALARAANLSGFIEETSDDSISPFVISALHLIEQSVGANDSDAPAFIAFARRLFFAFVASPSSLETPSRLIKAVTGHFQTSATLNNCLAVLGHPSPAGAPSTAKKSKKGRKSVDNDVRLLTVDNDVRLLTGTDANNAETGLLVLNALSNKDAPSRTAVFETVQARGHGKPAALLAIRLLYAARTASESEDLDWLKGMLALCAESDRRVIARDAFSAVFLRHAGSDTDATLRNASAVFALFSSMLHGSDLSQAASGFLALVSDNLKAEAGNPQNLSKAIADTDAVLPFLPQNLLDNLLQTVMAEAGEGAEVDEAIGRLLQAREQLPTTTTGFVPSWATESGLRQLLRMASNEGVHVEAARRTMERLASLCIPAGSLDSRSANRLGGILRTIGTDLFKDASLMSKLPTVASACLYRSDKAIKRFEKAVRKSDSVSLPLLSCYLDIQTSLAQPVTLPEELLRQVTKTAIQTKDAHVLRLLARTSSSVASNVVGAVQAHVGAIPRDDHSAAEIDFCAALADEDCFASPLESIVNGSFAGLVRRFAEDDEDTDETLATVQALIRALRRHKFASLKAHLLDPLMTAGITRRLDKLLPVQFLRVLAETHHWSDNESTRHLNDIFASTHYQALLQTSSSEFEELRSEVVRLVVALSKTSLSAVRSTRCVERLLPLYGGTLSTADQAVFELLVRVEQDGSNAVLQSCKLWRPSLDASAFDDDAVARLAFVTSDMMKSSWAHAAGSPVSDIDEPSKVYDSRFTLPYCLSITAGPTELRSDDWRIFLQSDIVGVAFAALASSSEAVRLQARATLAALRSKLEASRIVEKDEWLVLIDAAKNSVYNGAGEPIPAIVALFFAHCAHFIAHPTSPIYPSFSRFLLQRPLVDQRDVPLFYLFLYSSSDSAALELEWLVSFLADSLLRSQDWRVLRRRQVFEVLASTFAVHSGNAKLRRSFLRLVKRAASIRVAAEDLVYRHGILDWIKTQRFTDVETSQVLAMLSTLTKTLPERRKARLSSVLPALDFLASRSPAAFATASSDVYEIVIPALAELASHTLPSELPISLNLAEQVVRRLPQPAAEDEISASRQYTAVMLLSFVSHKAARTMTAPMNDMVDIAVRVGLQAGLPELRRETLRVMRQE